VLAGVKIIAEAWDAAGLYQVGEFIGDSWKEWNGRFRDDIRAFIRGEDGTVRRFSERLLGSPDIYGHEERDAEQSVNFVTCHDGLTLNDVVSYNEKHNESNGENGRDGICDNQSWNCGVEGPTEDVEIEKLRNRQIKNFFTITLLSLGVPMILMGDEVRRTQHGNNNAYTLDNETNWFDWTLVERHKDLHRFVTLLIARRLLRDVEPEEQRLTLNELLRRGTMTWHGTKLYCPDWGHCSHSLAMGADLRKEDLQFHIIWNAYWESLEFELPSGKGGPWQRWIDTALECPDDIVSWQTAPRIPGGSYRANARSVVVLYRSLIETSRGWRVSGMYP
jgi:glycogen operon protein